ncbi:hypothetical protein [Phenylobacterium sp.]|jgi:hypothetical protein|uniref:hypothetical protein n=1 Tax=Phenylobacterium sp. TaxID=1871053 RepID=UPI002F3F2F59
MAAGTIVAGLAIPSSAPPFLMTVAIHVGFGLTCVVAGAVAMLSPKRAGRHPLWGTVYFWSLAGLALTAAGLAVVRWAEDWNLFVLDLAAFGAALAGWVARRRQPPNWARVHAVGMGMSYIMMLTAFYVDNGKSLPLWRALPAFAYWLGPGAIGIPILLATLRRHPLLR